MASNLSADDSQNVPVRILEPDIPELPGEVDIALPRNARQIVVLEYDPLGLQRSRDFLGVVDNPGRGRRLVGSGELRHVDHEGRLPALVVRHRLLSRRYGREAELALVKILRALQITNRDR